MSAPVKMTSPADGATLPPMTLSRVDLPAPFGPHSPNRPRSGSASVTSCSTLRPPYSLKTDLTSSSAVLRVAAAEAARVAPAGFRRSSRPVPAPPSVSTSRAGSAASVIAA